MTSSGWLGGGAFAVLGLVAAAALPASKSVSRVGFVAAAPSEVYAVLSSTEGFQTFNPYRDEEPDLKIEAYGPPAGVGAQFSFTGKSAEGTQTITAVEPNRSVTMQIDVGMMGKPVQTFTLEPAPGGTQVTWTTESAFGYNPLRRVSGLFLDGYLGPIYERGLANLAKVMNKNHAPSN